MGLLSKKNTSRETKPTADKRAAVTQYYRSKNNDSPSPFLRKDIAAPYRKVVFGVVDIAVIFLLLAGLIYSLMLKAKPKVIVSNTYFHSQQQYMDAAVAVFSGVKNTNKITVDESDIARNLKQKFPEISNVQIELPFLSQSPTLRLSIAKPTIELKTSESAYVIDSDGVVVGESAALPKLRKITAIEDQSGFQTAEGKQALSSDEASFIEKLMLQLDKAKIPIDSVALPKVPQELDVRTKDQKYYVKFNTAGDVLIQAGQYLAARRQFQQSGPPSEYLDVRIAGKIFYR